MGTRVAPSGVFPRQVCQMTRTVGFALGMVLIVLFFAALGIESTRASESREVPASTRSASR